VVGSVISVQGLYFGPVAAAEGFGELAGGGLVPCSYAGDELYLQEKTGCVAVVFPSGDEQHGSEAFLGYEGKRESSVGTKSVEPDGEGMGRSSVHVEDVAVGERGFGAGLEVHVDPREVGQVVFCTLGEVVFNLIRVYEAGLAYKLREQGGVVAGAGADVDYVLAFFGREGGDAEGVKAGLAVVERFSAAERDDEILIENGGIFGDGFDVTAAGEDSPRGWTDEVLAGCGGEGSGKFAALRKAGIGGDQIGEKRSVCLNAVHDMAPDVIVVSSLVIVLSSSLSAGCHPSDAISGLRMRFFQ
jgi:hypothetical protein